jgi:hypothetical protein
MIYRVPGLSRVDVPAAVAGVPGELGPVEFFWPTSKMLVGVQAIPVDGDPASLGPLSLVMVDEDDEQVITTYGGLAASGPLQPNAVPLLSLVGISLKTFTLQRLVKVNERYLLTLKNFGAAPAQIAALLFHVEDL